jgi:hypothetical protein
VLTGYASPLYDEHLSGWPSVRLRQKCLIARGCNKPFRDEVIWVSRERCRREVTP